MGPQGPVGPVATRTDILAAVDEQFAELRRQMDIQLHRTAQVQQQIDSQRRDVAELREQLKRVHATLKELMRLSTA